MEELPVPRQEQLIQIQPSPNMARAQIPLPDLPEMFHLGEAVDFPAEPVHVARVAKATFSVAL
jgi:hypothetical protein